MGMRKMHFLLLDTRQVKWYNPIRIIGIIGKIRPDSLDRRTMTIDNCITIVL